MIVPRFTVSQNEEFVIVVARTPYIRANEADFYLMEEQFKFYCKPYFLRLTFSHRIVENGRESASYNVDTQEFTFKLPKATMGEHFSDLDMITKLLDKKQTNTTAKIQVMSSTSNDDDNEDDQNELEQEEPEEDEDEEWEFDQVESTSNPTEFNPSNLEEFDALVNETEFEQEGQQQDEIPKEIVSQINSALAKKITIVQEDSTMTTAASDAATTNISKKPITFTSLKSTIVAGFRRSLAFPLYRSWNLNMRVLEDTKAIFQLGKRCLLKSLLHIRRCLESHETKYYLNRLYIDDYCVWLQYASKKKLKSLRNKLAAFTIEKVDVDWPLEAYEKLVEEEGMVFGGVDQEDDEDQEIQDDQGTDSDESNIDVLVTLKNVTTIADLVSTIDYKTNTYYLIGEVNAFDNVLIAIDLNTNTVIKEVIIPNASSEKGLYPLQISFDPVVGLVATFNTGGNFSALGVINTNTGVVSFYEHKIPYLFTPFLSFCLLPQSNIVYINDLGPAGASMTVFSLLTESVVRTFTLTSNSFYYINLLYVSKLDILTGNDPTTKDFVAIDLTTGVATPLNIFSGLDQPILDIISAVQGTTIYSFITTTILTISDAQTKDNE
eukprot:gene1139-1301_t